MAGFLSVRNLCKRFGDHWAVDDVSFDIERNKTFGLVGESGCGKTTTLKLLLGLEQPTAGQIFYEGEDVSQMSKVSRQEFSRSVQAVFQDPWSSLNPRMRVRSVVGEPLEIATTMTKGQITTLSGPLGAEPGKVLKYFKPPAGLKILLQIF